ncbi:MAG: phenylalanine--tRNA ligase subunit beta, partial [Bacteroidetes bacterium]|nr:phenylalanine--tRNA ligase subunit beta [Bacteroidota bacterium]
KTAVAGTKFTTLDKIERTFTGIELLICDSEKPLAIGGVLGGLDSGVSESTTSIFIESAYFNAASVRKTAKTHGISTDASFRFERGTDPEGVVEALNKTVTLVQEIAGGTIASKTYDLYPTKVPATSLNFSLQKMNSLIGQEVPTKEVKAILTNLGIIITEENGDILALEIPARKSDVTRQADVTEEVLRIYGLNQINFPDQMLSSQSMSVDNVYHQFKNKVSDLLSSNGYYEMMTNSLTSSNKIENKDEVVTLLNPLSNELDSMRQSMLHSSLQAMSYNKNRQIHNVLLYEFGKTYFKTGESKYKEFQKLSIIIGGNRENENFEGKPREAGFYFMKSTLEKILELAGFGNAELIQKTHTSLDENCVFIANNKEIAHFGFVNNQLQKQYDITGKALFAEIDWNALCKSFVKQKQTYVPVPKFPSVKRDLALLVREEVTFKQIADLIKQTERKLLQEVSIFDVYKGKNIEEGKKSYAISLKLFDAEKTLTDDIVEKSINKILQRLEKELEVKIR